MIKNRVGLPLLACLGIFLIGCGSDGSNNNGTGGTPGTGGSGGGMGNCESGEVECIGAEGDCIPAPDASLAWVQANVFEVNGCALPTCHAGANPNPLEDLDLTSAEASFASLVGVESSQAAPRVLVVESDSESSYLVNKLTGVDIAPMTLLMPIGAPEPICDAKIDGVRAWIDAGANP